MLEILDLLLREDLTLLEDLIPRADRTGNNLQWRNKPIPPASLLEFITNIRHHNFERMLPQHERSASLGSSTLARNVAVGMNAKKTHEVSNLARYVDALSSELNSKYSCQISHFVDFGSGQNYLGRALASPPYDKLVVALESKPLNIDGARGMDITAKLAKKEAMMRNKKQHRSKLYGKHYTEKPSKIASDEQSAPPRDEMPSPPSGPCRNGQQSNMQYIETRICDGNLSSVLAQMSQDSSPSKPNSSSSQTPDLMVISLHSCGNLLHHGLRSLTLNPSVRAVALVGCCYNLLTERLAPLPGSSTSKFRAPNARLNETSSTCDPHGFPMSERFLKYKHPQGGEGIRFNITARMMAVQAPRNWTQADCSSFFTRHFYRALFQRILLDKGVIDEPVPSTHPEEARDNTRNPESNQSGKEEKKKKEPIILGSLRKPAYTSFLTYVRAAIAKLATSPSHSALVAQHLASLSDEEILSYEKKYAHKKKELSIVWSLMAFAAQVVESAIVVDRWCWLREQQGVKEAWVENIFDYGISPRNLVVVGIKG
ncbi:MAG: hypothetical protein L6R36_006587 [Xanthoria steineri]|nr:MAG: hypothetical protein L6R36_006587 [Xanthoria steineri]